MSTRKREREDDESEESYQPLDIATTAAGSLEHLGDQQKVFSVIKAVDKIFGRSKHKVVQRFKEWPKRIILLFPHVSPYQISLAELEELLNGGHGFITDIELQWNENLDLSVIIATPGDDKRETIYPIHNQQFFRTSEFKKVTREFMLKEKSMLFKTWKEDLNMLDALVTIVYNCEENLNFVNCNLDITPKQKQYSLNFQNLGRITYSFLEYLLKDQGHRITDVSISPEEMCITVLSQDTERKPRFITMRRDVSDVSRPSKISESSKPIQ